MQSLSYGSGRESVGERSKGEMMYSFRSNICMIFLNAKIDGLTRTVRNVLLLQPATGDMKSDVYERFDRTTSKNGMRVI